MQQLRQSSAGAQVVSSQPSTRSYPPCPRLLPFHPSTPCFSHGQAEAHLLQSSGVQRSHFLTGSSHPVKQEMHASQSVPGSSVSWSGTKQPVRLTGSDAARLSFTSIFERLVHPRLVVAYLRHSHPVNTLQSGGSLQSYPRGSLQRLEHIAWQERAFYYSTLANPPYSQLLTPQYLVLTT